MVPTLVTPFYAEPTLYFWLGVRDTVFDRLQSVRRGVSWNLMKRKAVVQSYHMTHLLTCVGSSLPPGTPSVPAATSVAPAARCGPAGGYGVGALLVHREAEVEAKTLPIVPENRVDPLRERERERKREI